MSEKELSDGVGKEPDVSEYAELEGVGGYWSEWVWDDSIFLEEGASVG